MNIVAIYPEGSLALLRRVKAPLTVLANRGYRCSFMQVPSFSAGLSYGHTATLLCGWVLSDQEMEEYRQAREQRLFIYDLPDLTLLTLPRVQEQIRLAHLVTVPTPFIKKEVALLNSNVAVTPSCIDMPTCIQVNNEKMLPEPHIGCFGPYDWYLIDDLIKGVKEAHPSVVFLGDQYAKEQLGDLVKLIDPSYYFYALHTCSFGLCPQETERGIDLIWALEYGIYSRPAIELRGRKQTERWQSLVNVLLWHPSTRAEMGQDHFVKANAHRSTVKAAAYLQVYRKRLPQMMQPVV